MRRLLLDWKRAIHNHRPTTWGLAGCPQVEQLLDRTEGLAEDMRAWARDVESFHRTLEEGEVALESDWAAVRESLGAAWGNQFLQRGILFARPELHRELERRLDDRRRLSKPDRRTEKCELALLAFSYRASTKTSPFSTLTITAVGCAADDDAAFAVPDLRRCLALPLISPHIVAEIARQWLARQDVLTKAPLAAPELLHVERGRMRFFTQSADENGGTGEVVRELSDAPVAEVILSLLGAAAVPPSLPSFTQAVATTLECEERRVSELLGPLVDVGLVRPLLAYDACRPHAVDSLLAAARALDCQDLGAECEILASVVARLRTIADVPAHEQAARLAAIETDIGRLLSGAEIPRGSVVFDRCTVSETVPIPGRAFRSITPMLEHLLNVLPLFNVDLGAAAVLQDFFRERCVGGETLAILPSFADLWQHLYRRYETGNPDPYQRAADEHPATAASTAERRLLVGELRARMAEGSANGVELPPDFFCRWAARARSFVPGRASLSANFLGQFATTSRNDSFMFVLNSVAPGYGALSAGWTTSLSANSAGVELRSRLVDGLRAIDPDGEVVEIAAALGFGGQVRDCLTTGFLSYPGSPYVARANERIAWDDLGLVLDERLDRVVLARRTNGRRVLPVHLGTISPRHFPPFYRFLIALGPAFTPSFSVIDFVEEELSRSERLRPRHYPRVTGGSLMLSRETWCVPSADLPTLGRSRLTFAEYLELRRWARGLDLPARVFVTGAQPAEILRDGFDVDALKRARKPFFVDFDDHASCVLFSRNMRRAGTTVRFVEAVPWETSNPFRDVDGPRAVEVSIEIQCGSGS